jgi:phosphotransferase system HPr (HPr) family protein
MISRNITIENKTGIHARPASLFIGTASKFKSNITLENNGKKGNAKSMINILGLCITAGSEVTITADGEDETQAVEALVKLIESKFGEE